MRHDKGTFYSMPKSAHAEPMPSKAFKLLSYLYSISRMGGECRPGYAAMQNAIRDRESDKGSRSTVKASLDYLDKAGWFLRRQKTNWKMVIYLRKEPLRLRKKQDAGSPVNGQPEVQSKKLPGSPSNGQLREIQWMDCIPEKNGIYKRTS